MNVELVFLFVTVFRHDKQSSVLIDDFFLETLWDTSCHFLWSDLRRPTPWVKCWKSEVWIRRERICSLVVVKLLVDIYEWTFQVGYWYWKFDLLGVSSIGALDAESFILGQFVIELQSILCGGGTWINCDICPRVDTLTSLALQNWSDGAQICIGGT